MKSLSLLIFLALLPFTALSLDDTLIVQVVTEEKSPVSGARIGVFSKSSTMPIDIVVADSVGTVKIENINRDSSYLIIEAVGYNCKEAALKNCPNPFMIELKEKSCVLDEVSVTANTTLLSKNKVLLIPSKNEKKLSNGGFNLLYNMPISTVAVDPLTRSVTTNMGDGVSLFINGAQASVQEVQNIRSENVSKIEYLENPTDPRFQNAKYALNYIVERYEKGGYTKIDTEQKTSDYAGEYTVYSHYEVGKVLHDLLLGYDIRKQSHISEISNTSYMFPSLAMQKDEYMEGRKKNRQGYATYRNKYVGDSVTIDNKFGIQASKKPYLEQHGSTILQLNGENKADEFSFDSREKEKSCAFEWDGNYFFKLRKGFSLSTEVTFSYMDTSLDYYYVTDKEDNIINNIDEKAWNLMLNSTLRKSYGKSSLGFNLIGGVNGNKINYKGSTPSNVEMKEWFLMPRMVFSFRRNRFYSNGNVGFSYDQTTYNGQCEKYFIPKTYISGGLNINDQNSVSFSFEYSMYGNSLGMKSPNYIKKDKVTAIKGNPALKNYNCILPSVSYKLVPSKIASFNIFSQWKYFNRPTVFCWEPFDDESGNHLIIRSYTNSGYFSNFRMGASGTLRLLNNKLFIRGTLIQNNFRQTGQRDVNSHPLTISSQVNYRYKNFSLSGYWQKSSKNISTLETRINPQNYHIAFSYGNGNLTASVTWKNMFNNRWLTTETLYNSEMVSYNNQSYGDGYHQSLIFNVSYSFSYGKKTNMNDKVQRSGMPGTAIIE